MANFTNIQNNGSLKKGETLSFQTILNENKGLTKQVVGRVNMTHIFTEISARKNDESNYGGFIDIFVDRKPPGHGNVFGQKYGFIPKSDINTGVGKTIIGGFYLYYGVYGVLFGLFFLGILYRLISNFLTTNVGLLFYSIIAPKLMSRIEMEFYTLFGDIILYGAIVIFIHLMIIENGIIDRIWSIMNYKRLG